MRKSSKWFVLLLTLVLVMSCFAGCGGDETPPPDSDDQVEGDGGEALVMPDDLKAFVDDQVLMVEGLAEKLNGEWADGHAALVALGLTGEEAMAAEGYADLKATLDAQREELGANYIYAVVPNEANEYCITVDGSPEPDTYGENYGWEIQFDEAWAGAPAAARSAWDEEEEGATPCWSTFAPVYTTDGELTCIIGIDYPCELVENYPEWNRDRDEWNGLEE